MDTLTYEYIGPITEYRYQFKSISAEREVVKVVRFSEIIEDMFNLALFDEQIDGGESSDKAETRNRDMNVVLATVMKIVDDFLCKNQKSFVYVEGSDAKRKRLYQILLNREYDNLTSEYLILGGLGDKHEIFEKGKTYQFFIITKKKKYEN